METHEGLTTQEFNEMWRTVPDFATFARKVYNYLEAMPPGKVLRLTRYKGEKLKWIKLTAATFICEGLHAADYEFLDDYSGIVHRCVPPEDYRRLAEWKGLPVHYMFPEQPKPQKITHFSSGKTRLPPDFQAKHVYKTLNQR